MNEFEIIRRYFESKDLPVSVKLGVGDDGAIIHNDPGKNLVVATDTLVSGVHFPADSSACDIGYRSVVVKYIRHSCNGRQAGMDDIGLIYK